MMNIQQAQDLKRLGKKMLDPEVWDEVQRLTDPNAAFGAKVVGGVVSPPEHSLVTDSDGSIHVMSDRPGSTAKTLKKGT